MKSNELNTARMFSSVQATLAAHEADNTWNKIPALVKASDELDTVVTGIAAQLEITAMRNGAVNSKDSLLEALATAAHEVAASLHAYAVENGNDELAAEVDLSITDIAKGRPAAVVARCANIAALGSKHLEALSDYNITQAKLTALTKKRTAFEQQVPKARQAVAKKAAANKAARSFLKQGRDLLNKRIDKLMVQFRETEPALYAEYQTARKIVNSPGAQNEKAETPTARATNGSMTNGVMPGADTAVPQNGHAETTSQTTPEPSRVA